MGSSLTKASFQDLEGSAGTLTVQFNPKEFNSAKQMSWQPGKDQGQGNVPLEFQKGNPTGVDMLLFFDTTMDNQDVRQVWVNKLLAFMNADVDAQSDKKGPELGKKRPPKVLFTWGSYSFTCVVEQVTTTYLMFGADGAPLRAKCQIKLKEWMPESAEGSGVGTTLSLEKVSLVTANAGDTASSVAAGAGVPWRELAADNDIDDPMADLGGQDLVVRSPSGAGNPFA
jgi:hypothetical protein